ncbi:ribosome silencing factor [Consotaella salsifontis]|nr:ribosome silencing factor [Consotaella salsifontis]
MAEAKVVTKTTPSEAPSVDRASAENALETVLASLEDSKGEDIVSIDMNGKSALADFMVVASGRSHRHVGAVAERLLRDLKDAGHKTKVEGLQNGDWVLIDTGDIIVHIFRPEVRAFYNIEKMWSVGGMGEAATIH